MKILDTEIISQKTSANIFFGVKTFVLSFLLTALFFGIFGVIVILFNLNVDLFFGTGTPMAVAGALIPVVSLAIATYSTSKSLLKDVFFKGNKKRIVVNNTISFAAVFFGLSLLMYDPSPHYGVAPDFMGGSIIVIFAAIEYFVLSKFFLRRHS